MDGESQAQREARLRSLWLKLDTKRKGTLDFEALKRGLVAANHRMRQESRKEGDDMLTCMTIALKDADNMIKDMLTACDIDHDGKISYDEFCRFCTETEKELWQLFQSIDKDHSGKLDKGELSSAFERAGVAVSSARLDRFFSYIDKDRDGTIDFNEWRGRHNATRTHRTYVPYEDRVLIFCSRFSLIHPSQLAWTSRCHILLPKHHQIDLRG